MTTLDGYGFGELLTHLRKQRRISQDILAKKLDVHRNTVGKWERGICLPESKTIVLELAKQLRLNEQETQHLLEASLTAVSPYWNVPHQRNLFFTGRGPVLEHLHTMLKREPSIAALTQSYGLHGLGGIGKTQLAIEYAYQHRTDYETVLWVEAETQTTLVSSFIALATLLALPDKTEGDQSKIVAAVLRWLNQHQGWLLIFDNVEDLSLLKPFLPASNQGALLFTTRLQSLGTLAQRVELFPMTMQEGCDFLLARTHHPGQDEENTPIDDQERAIAQQIVTEMGGLPLALEQAGAYIEETGCSFGNYLQLYQHHHNVLLARRGTQITSYPDSVATTWSLSFQKVEQANPAAAELLQLCALLAPDHIPEELLKDAALHWPPALQQATTDLFAFDQMLAALLTFSLIKRFVGDRMLSIHRLVQVVQLERMDPEKQRQWAERVVSAVNTIFPRDPKKEIATWPQCLRYLEQAQTCAKLIQQWKLTCIEGAELLDRTGVYLREQGQYTITEPLFLRALCIREELFGLEHPSVAILLNEVARLYVLQGKYTEAELLYERALYIWKQSLGPEHPNMATSLYGLASLYQDQGKYEDAKLLHWRALRIWEQMLGPKHPDVARALTELGKLYRKQGDYKEAEALYQRALSIMEQSLGPEHPYVANLLNGLAIVYEEQGDYKEAEALYQRALSIWEQSLGPEHPYVAVPLNNLADLYYARREYLEAETLYQRALGIWEQSLGLEHPQVALSLNGLGNLYREQGRYTKAEPLYQRALHIREHALEPDHPSTAETLHSLGALREAQGNSEDAISLYSRALVIYEHVYGQQHSKTIATRERLQAVLGTLNGQKENNIEHKPYS